jgi:hypothetical protein
VACRSGPTRQCWGAHGERQGFIGAHPPEGWGPPHTRKKPGCPISDTLFVSDVGDHSCTYQDPLCFAPPFELHFQCVITECASSERLNARLIVTECCLVQVVFFYC